MSSSVTVEAHRRRFAVKATPMMPLSAVVADVLGQLKLAGQVQPQECQLLLKGKPLDLGTPVRFANIGRDKLELKTGREPVLGVQDAPAAAAPPPAPVPVLQTQHAAAAAAAPAAPAEQLPLHSQQAQSEQPKQVDPSAAEQASGTSVGSVPAPAQPARAPVPAADSSQPSGAADPAPMDASAGINGAAPEAPADSHPSVALFGRRVWVFTRQAEQQAEGGTAGAGPAEVDESFYDFTEADLRRAMASQASARARQEGGHLMTAAMREREERRRAESYGDVPIRLYLPDGQHCLQTVLPATAPLSEVLALARAALAPAAAAAAYLFTTPPRQVVKDLSPSLYAAKLIPAAKVHVGLDAGKMAAAQGSDVVRPEVATLAEAPPQRAEVMHTRPGGARQQQQGQQGSAAAGAGPSRAYGAAQVQKGVPKWLKLGGK